MMETFNSFLEGLESTLRMLGSVLSVAYMITNFLFIGLLVGTYRRPAFVRFMLFLIFLGAAFFNTRTALNTPWVYQNFADHAIAPYRTFILGTFEAIIQPMVWSIALGQVFIAVTTLMKGNWYRLGCLSGIIFSVCIAPLGLGAAFPAPLIMAATFYQLYRQQEYSTPTTSNKEKSTNF